MGPRIIVRIEVTEAAKNEIDDLTAKFGMTHLSIHSRIVEWFSTQPDQIRAFILQQFPAEIKGDIASLILKNMRSGGIRASEATPSR
jgi:hypothetical protein